jgi:hypothetical protein
MTRALERRLQKLGAAIAKRQAERLAVTHKSRKHLIRTAIGYYLGEPRPNESPWEAIARAFGFKDGMEMGRAFDGPAQDFAERMRQAERKLFARFGVDLDGDQDELDDAFKRMEVGLSEPFREELRQQRKLTGC